MEDKGKSDGGSSKREGEVDLVWRRRDRKLGGGILVGRLVTDKKLNVNMVIQMIRKGWNLEKKEELEIIEVDHKSFLFEFKRREEYCRILRGQPWSVNGCLMNVQQWEEDMVLSEADFNLCPFWVQFHDLPLAAIDVENAKRMGLRIGDVVLVEDPVREGMLVRSFLRARVVVDLRKPLVTGLRAPREGKEPALIKIRYERLSNLCYDCGRIEHDIRSCPYRSEDEGVSAAGYGSWLGIQAARRIDELIVKCREDWEEVDCVMLNRTVGRIREDVWEKGVTETVLGNEVTSLVKERVQEKVAERDCENDEKIKMKEMVGEFDNVKEGSAKADGRRGFRRRNMERGKRLSSTPRAENDASQALVMYGSVSPMSEMVVGLSKVGLKRALEETEEGRGVKKRRLDFGQEVEVG